MNCSRCGREFQGPACPYCGQRAEGQPASRTPSRPPLRASFRTFFRRFFYPSSQTPPSVTPAPGQTPPPKKAWKKWQIVLLAAAVLGAAALLGILFGEPAEEPPVSDAASGYTSGTEPEATDAATTGESTTPATEPAPAETQAPTDPPATDSPTQAPATQAPVTQPTAAPLPPATQAEIRLLSVTSPVGRNETAALRIQGTPGTEYAIAVYYSSGPSEADGLENKVSGSDGVVEWSWKVGQSTKTGEHRIVISGGGQTLETSFTTTE